MVAVPPAATSSVRTSVAPEPAVNPSPDRRGNSVVRSLYALTVPTSSSPSTSVACGDVAVSVTVCAAALATATFATSTFWSVMNLVCVSVMPPPVKTDRK